MTSPLDQLGAAAAQLADATTEEAPHEPNAAEQIMALQQQIDELRDRAAAEDAAKPFVLHTAPGSGKAAYQTTGESLADIAKKLGLSNPYQELFQPNMSAIETAARAAGFPGGSDQGSILPAGVWLEVPASSLATKPE